MDLIALKPLRYGTRRLVPGDEFECPKRNFRSALIVTNRACLPDDPRAAEFKPKAKVDPEIDKLRAEYEEAFGEAPDKRWSADTLRGKLAES